MAVVYLAEQAKPLRRQVALKIIKLGMDTRQFVARFSAERQALAIMDQPCGGDSLIRPFPSWHHDEVTP